jgi:hypothetical protein
MRPKPRKPAVRVGEKVVVLSWGPHRANGVQWKVGHWRKISFGLDVEGVVYLVILHEGITLARASAGHERKHNCRVRDCAL